MLVDEQALRRVVSPLECTVKILIGLGFTIRYHTTKPFYLLYELFRSLQLVSGTVYRSTSHPRSQCQSSAVART